MVGMRFTATVITISDGVTSGDREDLSGDAAERLLLDAGFEHVQRAVVPDETSEIAASLRASVDDEIDLVVTTGGTGFGPRDVTPEATRGVIEREAPGLTQLMRAEGLKKTPMAALSRGVAGAAGQTLIVNLPGSPKAVDENLSALIPVLNHALETLRGQTRHA
jgi:molybdenum cofactor synthesis domain-containing protein